MVSKTDLMLIMETTWIFVVAFILPWLLHREFGRSTAGQGLWKMESCGKKREKKKVTHVGAPGVVEPHSGPVVVVPLPYAHVISRA